MLNPEYNNIMQARSEAPLMENSYENPSRSANSYCEIMCSLKNILNICKVKFYKN
jgi:hypothetical protein